MRLFDVTLYCKGKEDVVLTVSTARFHIINEEDPRVDRHYIVYDSSTDEYDSFDNFEDLILYIQSQISNYDFYDLPF